MRNALVVTAVVALLTQRGLAQQPAPLAECRAPAVVQNSEVSRQSLLIPMKDGVRLALDVYLPGDLGSRRLPTILVATRYWRAAEGQPVGPMERFWISRGYAYVYADVRGTGASFGQWFYPWSPTEVEDLGAVAAWIAAQPWSDGQVGSVGTSYTGNTAQLVAAANLPAIKAVVPRFMDFDVYADLTFPGGVANEMLLRDWGAMVHAMDMNNVPGAPRGVRRVDADQDGSLIRAAVADHQGNPPLGPSMTGISYRDDEVAAFGGATNDMSGSYRYRAAIERSRVPIFGWASWLDAGTAQGALNRFMNWSNPQLVVIGPWSHGGGNHTSPFLAASTPTTPSSAIQNEQAACFFDRHMRGGTPWSGRTLIYYTLGEETWRSTTTWPITGTTQRRFHFGPANQLSTAGTAAGTDRYDVDFEVTTGTTNRWFTQLGGQDVVYPDRTPMDARMLTYTSAALPEDMEVTGQAVVTLTLSTTASDGNFFVYLEDVSPAGVSTYVTEGMLRGLHRRLSADPAPYRTTYPWRSYLRKDGAPMVPGEVTTLTFQLLPTSVLFRAGHRIRVAVAGADKDTFQRTPAAGPVTLTVHHGGSRGSFIDLPVVPRSSRP